MKKVMLFYFLFFLCVISLKGQSTINYSYDDNGNRVDRHVIILKQSVNDNTFDSDELIYHDVLMDSEIKIFPNPVLSSLNIESSLPENTCMSIFIYGMDHKLIDSFRSYSNSSSVDFSSLAIGTYLLILQIGEERKTYKIIKE